MPPWGRVPISVESLLGDGSHRIRWGAEDPRETLRDRDGSYLTLNIAIAVSPLLTVTLRDLAAPFAGLQVTA